MSDLLSHKWSFLVCGLLIVFSSDLLSATADFAADPPAQTAVQWEPQKIRLAADDEHLWWTFPVTIALTHQATGERLVLEPCWDGGRDWVVRFAAPQPGVWTWQTFSDDAPAGQTEWTIPSRLSPADEDSVLCLEKRS